MIVSFFNLFISLGTIAAQLFIALGIVQLIFFRNKKNKIFEFASQNGLLWAFVVALIATLSSLFYSEFAGFPPCDLCWVQRAFMYPLVLFLGLALKDGVGKKDLIDFSLVVAAVGFLVSAYHNIMYYMQEGLPVWCQFSGQQVSCVKRYVFEFGYITIPMMAATSFALIIIFLVATKLNSSKNS